MKPSKAAIKAWLEKNEKARQEKLERSLHKINEEQVYSSQFNDSLIESVGTGDASNPKPTLVERDEEHSSQELERVASVSSSTPDLEYYIKTLGLRKFQAEAMPALMKAFCEEPRRAGTQIIEPTGHGKTFVGIALIKELRRRRPDVYPLARPILWITPIPEQTNTDIGMYGPGLNIMVLHPAKIRSTLGQLWVEWRNVVIDGIAQRKPFWKPENPLLPCFIVIDESQCLKNEDSDTSEIIRSLALLNYGGTVVPVCPMSATPYSRPYHVRTIACLLMPQIKIGREQPLTDKLFPTWIRMMCGPRVSPNDWSPAAMKRVQDVLESHTVRFGEPDYEYRMMMRMMRINFRSEQDKAIYQAAMDEWQQKRIEAEKDPLTGIIYELVALAKFLDTAEILRAPDYADIAYDFVVNKGKSVIIACKCRETFAVVKAHLIMKGVKEDEIAEIYGGQKDRAENRRRFQSDKARYMLLMFKAGGAGLSLHHFKPRNTHPRVMLMPGAWNVEDFVQVAGRAHRINSASVTWIFIIWYAGTFEEKQIAKVKGKARALKEVTKRRADWHQFTDPATKQIEDTKPEEDEDEECEEVTRPRTAPPIEVETEVVE